MSERMSVNKQKLSYIKLSISGSDPIQFADHPGNIILEILLLHPRRLFQLLQRFDLANTQTQDLQNIV